MIRSLYLIVLSFHPRSFRERFGPEMLGIFDEHAGKGEAALLFDAVISLLRQWALRPAYREPALSAVPLGQTSDIPAFYVFDDSPPPPSTLFYGAVLTLFCFSAVTFAIGRGGHLPRMLIGALHPRPQVLSFDRSSISEAAPTTGIRVAAKPADPWFQIANSYFAIIRVLDIMDADRDRIVSAREINDAPAALARLDQNRDGKLSPEECGFSMGNHPVSGSTVEHHRLFMRMNPVLAVLDNDSDSEISRSEISFSATALKTLDHNRDGALSPIELMPTPIAPR